MSETNWSEVGVSELLPSGTVTLLLADVEGSTRLWETQPDEMTAAVARLDTVVANEISAHNGVRPVEQGEGDSFVVAFARASDAVACALALQRAPLAPIRLRIGLHTGEVQLRDEGNYVGPTINRTARLRDLAHGGQTVLSGTTSDLVIDRLPVGAFLTDLGSHPLRDLPRPERVVQLCHPDLRNDYPPLRTAKLVDAPHFPVQLTSFVGRGTESAEVARMLTNSRLVTLTGAGGVGKTRLAIQLATELAPKFAEGAWFVDLSPITDPDVVPMTVIRALGLSDQPGRSTMDTLTRFIADRRMLLVLDNCEHLLDSAADLVTKLLSHCPRLTLLVTSREPVSVPGEATWRVPSLTLADEAVELFADRARLARPEFDVAEDSAGTVTEICRRLDGMPLAIELAAARVRALTLTEILDGLRDHFMLLTGGARTAVRRQQTLRASVDWSHALLSDGERTLFRRLAAFMGGFDLDAARAVASGDDLQPHQVLDQLTLLADKSLVVTDDVRDRTRYRLLETVRQYAQEKLSDSGEAGQVRARHREYYTARAATLATVLDPARWRLAQAEGAIDNLRAAFAWSRDHGDIEHALALTSMLWPLWVARGRLREGLAWFDAAFSTGPEDSVQPATLARALADRAGLNAQLGAVNQLDDARRALEIARDIGDPVLISRALASCAGSAAFSPDIARPYVDEAIALARAAGDRLMLCQALVWHGQIAYFGGNPRAGRIAAEEGRDIADAVGDRFVSRGARWALGWAQMVSGELSSAVEQLRAVANEAAAYGDATWAYAALFNAAQALCHLGDIDAARRCAEAARHAAGELGSDYERYFALHQGYIAIAAGDVDGAESADEEAWRGLSHELSLVKISLWRRAATAQARGDLTAARRWADDAVTATTGCHRAVALTTRARVAIAQGDTCQAERDAHAALAAAADMDALLGVPDTLECLAVLARDADTHPEAARLLGAAEGIRQRTGEVRFPIYQSEYEAAVDSLRQAMEQNDFDDAWAEGAQLTTEEAIAYAQRGRGDRKRPSSGWESLTPAEHDVVRLVCEGLSNKEVATRLFVSPRTVQAHLSHVYAKLGISTRVQLVADAARTSRTT
ncbi:LuxR family transcriptional regulator [Mycolicibacterium tusciae]|uniref:LuxR family transcriptional regulator n=1 Tax=Mycolicibacterium tusciae TaxID=75922 RepID=UPI00024A4B86|nr:LuxR family transcriptional regulator [Mycolicibacterium tusciae]